MALSLAVSSPALDIALLLPVAAQRRRNPQRSPDTSPARAGSPSPRVAVSIPELGLGATHA